MRKKSITALVCVYAALCMVPDSDSVIQSAEQESSDIIALGDSSDNSCCTVTENPSASETESTETSDNTAYQWENDSSAGEETVSYYEAEESDTSSYPEPDTPQEIISRNDSEEESQEQIDDEDEYQEEKPSLSEYLSGLRCSGCRHNCSLLSPRCMNGARKASQAESQYYQTYGA